MEKLENINQPFVSQSKKVLEKKFPRNVNTVPERIGKSKFQLF